MSRGGRGPGHPVMYDYTTKLLAGINPRTNDLNIGPQFDTNIKRSVLQAMETVDRQQALRRYTWYNLPEGLDGEMIERILYYRGQLIIFWLDATQRFYCLPYALDGNIDVYGRYLGVRPVQFGGGTTDDKSRKDSKIDTALSLIHRDPIYEIPDPEDYINDDGEPDIDRLIKTVKESCVIVRDYSVGITQMCVPRYEIQKGILDIESDLIPYLHTALLNATGVRGVRVNSQDEAAAVESGSRLINRAAQAGLKYVAMEGHLDFQDLTDGAVAKAEEFLMSLQALDNYRLSLYGLDEGGLYQKKAHVLESEEQLNTANNGLVYEDGLQSRQKACTLINALWGTQDSMVWCMPSEEVMGADTDGDGVLGSNTYQQDGSGGSEAGGGESDDL